MGFCDESYSSHLLTYISSTTGCANFSPEGGERKARERGEERERGGRKGEGGEGEGRSLPYQSKNRSRAPDCV